MATTEGISIFKPQLGFIFEYAKRLMGFEFQNSTKQSDKVVLFVGGLTDGLLTVPYLPLLLQRLDSIGWTLVQILISSSYSGWGTGSLSRDVDEISKLVLYLHSTNGGSRSKIVLMGHSTGCQDTMQYLTKMTKDLDLFKIDGGILQAPVSDRESISGTISLDKLAKMNEVARDWIKQGKSDEVLPHEYSESFLGAPLSAYRWLSFSEVGGDDDYFSSDLSSQYLEGTFGKVKKPLLVLYSGKDEFAPEYVDKQKLISRWSQFVDTKYWSPYSRVVKGAKHAIDRYSDDGAQEEMATAVVEFLKTL